MSCILPIASDVVNDDQVAVKMELISSETHFLIQEAKMLKSISGLDRFPSFKWYGEEGDYNCLVMGLLGPSLEDLFKYCDSRFTLKTGLILMDQCLQCLEMLHDSDIVHRDIKPDNFCIGVHEKSELVHILDLGLAKYFQDPVTKNHIEFKKAKGLTGTPRYASINAHKGYEQSRRDDLEALGYMLIFLINGYLPWQGIKMPNKNEKNKKIGELKEQSLASGSLFKNLPGQFKEYFDIVRGYDFEDTPNYNKLRRIFKELFLDKGYSYNFDWQADDVDIESDEDSDKTKDSSIANQYDDCTNHAKNIKGEESSEIDITGRLHQC